MTKPHKTLDELLNEPAYLAERAAQAARDKAEWEANWPACEAKAERERLARVAAGHETEDGEPGPNADPDDEDEDEDCIDGEDE